MAFPVDEKFIRATEQKLGLRFPAAYVGRMMRINGGEVMTSSDSWNLYPILDTSDKKRLKRTCNDVVRETAGAREWVGFPKDAIAIGGNGSGDQLILIRDKNSIEFVGEEVYWWDHESGELHPVSDNLADLLDE